MLAQQYFPYAKIREKQEKALDFIERAVAAGYRDILISAPTGSGKTGIGAGACFGAGLLPGTGEARGYYLTSQKMLQDQIEADFNKMRFQTGASIKSASEYRCGSLNCAISRKPCRNGSCPYKVAKMRWSKSVLSVTNYAYFFTSVDHSDLITRSRILVCDECHNLEREVIRHVDLVVNEDLFEQWAPGIIEAPALTNIDEFVNWVETVYLSEVKARLEILIALAENDERALAVASDIEHHVKKTEHAVSLIKLNPEGWVFWKETGREGRVRYTARPLHAAPFFPELVSNNADVRVYMSAYPGDADVFCRSLGLKRDAVAVAKYGSVFAPENRPIVVSGCGSMSMRGVEASTPRLKRAIVKICDQHADQKGVIHCHSYKMAELVRSALSGTQHEIRVLTHSNSAERDEIFARHKDSPDPTIIVTPSMFEGFDFKSDLARWQVIVKVPYPWLGDAQVAAKKDLDQDWYVQQAVSAIIQASGRIVRDDQDWGVTYILDSDFENLYRRYEHMFPDWWIRALSGPA